MEIRELKFPRGYTICYIGIVNQVKASLPVSFLSTL